jgi:hypothetical protein
VVSNITSDTDPEVTALANGDFAAVVTDGASVQLHSRF